MQSTSIAIMATGMVLIIVSRNIDLSVGSLLGFLGYTMALVQTDGILAFFGIDVTVDGLADKSCVWIVALAFGLLLGALVGTVAGLPRGLRRGAVVHRHARRLPRLARPIFRIGRQAGPDARSRSTTTFQLLGGGAKGARSASGRAGSSRCLPARASCSASCSPAGAASATSSECGRCGPRSGSLSSAARP